MRTPHKSQDVQLVEREGAQEDEVLGIVKSEG